jgi:hypothetical protein
MKKEFIELAQRAKDEEWDSFRIMAEFISLQKEIDAKILEDLGYSELADKIRQQ